MPLAGAPLRRIRHLAFRMPIWAVVNDVTASPVVTTMSRVLELRAESIVRSRLARRLDSRKRLTLLTAPAGYGKTTALAQGLGSRAVWVPLPIDGCHPRRLCRLLLDAVRDVLPVPTHDAARSIADGGGGLSDAVVQLVAEALRRDPSPGEIVLVLDDYHRVDHPGAHQLVVALLERLPAHVRIVVSGRTEPPLRLGRRRAAGAVTEIGPDELRFDRAETARLLNEQLGLALDDQQLQAIEDRVDGWPAGLSLIAASLPARPDPDAFRRALDRASDDIAQFFDEEVLQDLPPTLAAFLRRTSILDRLSGSLCAAVLDDPDAHRALDAARDQNLFVVPADTPGHRSSVGPADAPYRGEAPPVRYQRAFAESMYRRLRREEPDLVPDLHLRAAEWHVAHDGPRRAFRHALAAGDGARAAELLMGAWPSLIRERRFAATRDALARLPAERGPYADFCRALDLLCTVQEGDDVRAVEAQLDRLERVRESPGVGPIVDLLRMTPYLGDVGRAVAAGHAVWNPHHEHAEVRSWLAATWAVVLWFAGDHDEMRDVLEPTVGRIPSKRARCQALSVLALAAAADDDLDVAERCATQAVEVAERATSAAPLELYLAYLARADVLRRRGALADAQAQLDRALDATRDQPGSVQHALALVVQAELALAARDRRRARPAAAMARRVVDRYPDVGTVADRLAEVEAALARRAGDTLLGSRPTAAELRLLAYLEQDLTLQAIADEHLYVSVHTVKSHAQRLYRRLGARTRREAVESARERGLL